MLSDPSNIDITNDKFNLKFLEVELSWYQFKIHNPSSAYSTFKKIW